jgi:hypothetical protein
MPKNNRATGALWPFDIGKRQSAAVTIKRKK